MFGSLAPDSYVEILTPKVMVIVKKKALGRLSGHETRILINGISALIK